jgi:UDP-N-acetylmuramoylalanine--D-glutamate ligase
MLESILAAAGLRTAAVGNIGRPIMEIVLDPEPYDVLAVELSSHQLHWSRSLAMHSAAVLNVQPDHLEWHGSYEAYRNAKATIYSGIHASCVYNVADPITEQMVEQAEVVEGARAIGFTLGTPGLSMLGVVDDLLVDRAFIEQRKDSALELAKVSDVSPAAPHNVANALAAAALARSYGVPALAVRQGLRTVSHLGGRVQGHQPPRRRCRAARIQLGGMDRRRPGQGHYLRRIGRCPPEEVAGRCAARDRSRDHRPSPRSTRPGSPHANH